jgi:tRNA pseudouridine38-40 synthase
MGTLVAIGCGDESEKWAGEVLESRDRKRGGVAAPPHGLTLVEVTYPQEFHLPPDPNQKLR